MFVCRLAIEIGFDFAIFDLNINVRERGERNGLGRRERRPKKIGRREKGSKKIGRRENQNKKGGRRIFFKKMWHECLRPQ